MTPNYRDPEALFDVYPYQRGAAVLHMLRRVVGDEQWWRALNLYLKQHAHQPVDTAQLQSAFEATTGKKLDWFFDEWVYKMGHPVLRVTQKYDAAQRALLLTVRQEQQPDPKSAYPQTTYFQMPVDVELATATGTRVERVQLAPQLEQTFTFKVDGPPLLVNFDYQGTLIKVLIFEKPTDALLYQLAHDEDVLGRVWALEQLKLRVRAAETKEAEQQRIADAVSTALTTDKFWGVRYEAAKALAGWQGARVRESLLAATKDERPKVRAQAIAALGTRPEPQLAQLFEQALQDQSYAVVGAAAEALGKTKAPGAYDALVRLLEQPSWREKTQAAALNGLAELGDKRALEIGLRYIAPPHTSEARRAAIYVIGAAGKDDPRVLPLLLDALRQSFVRNDFTLGVAAAETIYELDDERGLKALHDMLVVVNKIVSNADLQAFAAQVDARLRQKQAPASSKPGKL